jgi:hypothetical protein
MLVKYKLTIARTTRPSRGYSDGAFVRCLKTLRDDYLKKVQRCQEDLEAFNIAKKNHPTPELNVCGEPQ